MPRRCWLSRWGSPGVPFRCVCGVASRRRAGQGRTASSTSLWPPAVVGRRTCWASRALQACRAASYARMMLLSGAASAIRPAASRVCCARSSHDPPSACAPWTRSRCLSTTSCSMAACPLFPPHQASSSAGASPAIQTSGAERICWISGCGRPPGASGSQPGSGQALGSSRGTVLLAAPGVQLACRAHLRAGCTSSTAPGTGCRVPRGIRSPPAGGADFLGAIPAFRCFCGGVFPVSGEVAGQAGPDLGRRRRMRAADSAVR